MNKEEIKRRLREIELAYDYSHVSNAYECVFNLDELAALVAALNEEFVNSRVGTKSKIKGEN